MSYCIVIDKRKIIGGFYLKITGKGKGKRLDSLRNLQNSSQISPLAPLNLTKKRKFDTFPTPPYYLFYSHLFLYMETLCNTTELNN